MTSLVDPARAADHSPCAAGPGGVAVRRAVLAGAGRRAGWFAVSVAVLALLWEAAVRVLGLGALGARSASQVFRHLFLDGTSAGDRGVLADALATTAAHAALGFVSGTVVGVLLAVALVAVPRLERPLMPAVLLTQAVPVLAVLPLLVLLLGRGYLVTVTITTLSVFFPAFVLAVQGLRSVTPAHLDLFRGLDASPWTVLVRLRVPHAVPHLFAAARICVPGAVFGALVAEWLATGDGLGYLMVDASSSYGGYDLLWCALALTTVFTMACHTLVDVLELVALGRFAPGRITSGPPARPRLRPR